MKAVPSGPASVLREGAVPAFQISLRSGLPVS